MMQQEKVREWQIIDDSDENSYRDYAVIEELMTIPKTFYSGKATSHDADSSFRQDPMLSHIVIIDKKSVPIGLLTRESYYIKTGGAYGFALFLKKSLDLIGENDFLQVEVNTSVAEVAELAMSRQLQNLYDPIVVVDENGFLAGTVTIKELLGSAHSELVRSREQAELATLNKSEFIASVSHEIRTPMNAVINMIRAVLQTRLDEEQYDCLETARDASEYLLLLLNDILDISKIEAGKLELENVDADLYSVVNHSVKTMQSKGKKRVPLNVFIAQDVPQYIKTDPNRLRQVLLNLLGNAMKFTEKGYVNIKLELSEESCAERKFIKFSVIDSGIGVPPDKVSTLFEKFTQTNTSIWKRFGGSGLGLSICKKITELFGGRIWHEQNPEGGSIFSFTIEYIPGSRNATPNSYVSVSKNIREFLPGKLNILLVEDGLLNVKTVEIILKKINPQIINAKNGYEALEMLKKYKFDIILMDIEMPEMDGFEATRRFRNGETGDLNDGVPVIAMTAHAFEKYKVKCLEAGMNAFVTKPVNPECLIKEMSAILPEELKNRINPEENSTRNQPVKASPALLLFDGDKKLLEEYIRMFIEEGRILINGIENALAENDRKTVRINAHTMKSGAAQIMAVKCQGLAKLLENSAQDEPLETIREQFNCLKEEFLILDKSTRD